MRYTPGWDAKAPTLPVNKDGDFLHYPTYEHESWETIEQPFFAHMTIERMNKGRSAKWITLADPNGRRYPMFVADLVKGIQEGTMEVSGGRLSGYWTGSKRGQNYGVKTVEYE